MKLSAFTHRKWIFTLALSFAACLHMQAANLTGTTVSGNAGFGCNAFDSTSFCGGDYAGSGSTAVIGAHTPTFTGSGGHDYDISANFTADSLTLSVNGYEVGAPGMAIASMAFTDPAFAGLSLEVAGYTMFTSASQFTIVLVGDTVSFNSPGFPPEGTYTVTADFVSSPEPSSARLLLMVVAGLCSGIPLKFVRHASATRA